MSTTLATTDRPGVRTLAEARRTAGVAVGERAGGSVMENVLEDRAAVEVLEVLDFHATCDVAGCGGVAARVARLGCCGTEYLICDAHRDQIVAAYERPAHKYEERHVDRGVACFEVVPWVTFRPVGGPA